MSDAPLMVTRTAVELRADLVKELRANVPEWSPVDPQTGEPEQVGAALVGIFARFSEIVIQRLNRAPEKNFLAFLDLLGVAVNPPQPARVPLTFTLAPGTTVDAVVPAGTQAAAPAAEGDKGPVIFETERELTVVAAQVQTLIAVDAESDLVADRSALLVEPSRADAALFSGDRANEHLLYVGWRADLTTQKVTTLTLTLALNALPEQASREIKPADLQWEAWDGSTWTVLPPANVVQPASLSGQYRFSNLPTMPALAVAGVTRRWLRCRLLKPVSPATQPASGMLRASLLPVIDSALASATFARTGLSPDFAFADGQSLDTTRLFQPFGERPKIGDVFYLGSNEGFGLPGASVSIALAVANPLVQPPPADPSTPMVNPSSDLRLRWEAWTSSGWAVLGESTTQSAGANAAFQDGTRAFTTGSDTTVTFTLPGTVVPARINGTTSCWIRVQIVAGNYGRDARYVPNPPPATGFTLNPGTFGPPVLRSLTLGYSQDTAPATADLVGYNNLEFQALQTGGPMFRSLLAQPATLYVAFSVPPGRQTFPNRAIALYHALRSFQYGELAVPLHPDRSVLPDIAANSVATHRFTLTNPTATTLTFDLSTVGGSWSRVLAPTRIDVTPGEPKIVTVAVTVPAAQNLPSPNTIDRGVLVARAAGSAAITAVTFETRVGQVEAPARRVRWEYWNGREWTKLSVADGTDRLSRTGIVEFLGPADIVSARRFGVDGYWLRVLFEPGDKPLLPRLRALVPNTTMASQTITVRNEVLGSSDASESQQLQVLRAPVLPGQILEVREPGPLPEDELAALIETHGADAVAPASTAGRSEFWVRWTEVMDLHGAGPLDRCYVLDRLGGRITFGDGAQGRIPPRGVANVRLAHYRTGGGEAGNRSAGGIVQMKTTVPYVEKVTNPDAAAGGFAAESNASLVTRAPRTLRHSGRAVAADDYEDLARLASPEVARASCVPLRYLQDNPLSSVEVSGSLSLIIVPASTDAKPLPSLELLEHVAEYLRARQAANAAIAVIGPLYIRVDVDVEVVLERIDGANEVEQAIRTRLAAFLHPLTGGRDGNGWDFGREPQTSDLYAIVDAVAGVDHIRKLSATQHEDLVGSRVTGRFLVYSGQHRISLKFVGSE